jgi:hypothetical protein
MKTWIVGLGVMFILISMAIATSPLDAIKDVGKVSYPVVDLRGTSPAVFNSSGFEMPALNHRGLEEWTSGMQNYDYIDFPWSLRDFLDYEKPL